MASDVVDRSSSEPKFYVENGVLFTNNFGNLRLSKAIFTALTFQVGLFAIVYYRIYPLVFPGAKILQTYIYWLLLVTAIASAVALAYYGSSVISSFVATLVFYFTLTSYQILYFGGFGGDSTGEIIDISLMSRFVHLNPDLLPNFGYLNWPAHYFYALSISRIYSIENIINTTEIGHLTYFLLLLVAVWLFAYRLGNGFLAFVASSSYLIISLVPLNNQFVPQLLALGLLFVLVYLMNRDGRQWRLLEGVFFVTLVLTHPVFPVFYLIALSLRPGITSILQTYEHDESFSTVIGTLRHPLLLLKRLVSPAAWLSNGRTFYLWITGLWIVYFLKNSPTRVISFVTGSSEIGGNPFVRIFGSLLPINDSLDGGGEAEVQSNYLYELVPELVDAAVTRGSRIVVVSVFVLLVVSFLFSDIKKPVTATKSIGEYRIELIIASGLILVFTAVVESTYGFRVLQVAFFPMMVFFYGLRTRRDLVVKVLICLALLSPVLLANIYVNSTLVAGGNTMSYDETKAGQTVGDHYDAPESVIVPPHTPYPIGHRTTPAALDIRFVIQDEPEFQESGPLLYSTRLTKYLEYRGYECEIDPSENQVVYDNGAQLLWQSQQSQLGRCLG
ncbi:hypothetical protein [Halorarius litoreus]|uniref:hypothetical protein n=1 Tax=Halorarius litoreus TaxID=2962676 RepID=UPI0020CBB6B7|nr:hypothetical protein [Halorarius litoreus]